MVFDHPGDAWALFSLFRRPSRANPPQHGRSPVTPQEGLLCGSSIAQPGLQRLGIGVAWVLMLHAFAGLDCYPRAVCQQSWPRGWLVPSPPRRLRLDVPDDGLVVLPRGERHLIVSRQHRVTRQVQLAHSTAGALRGVAPRSDALRQRAA